MKNSTIENVNWKQISWMLQFISNKKMFTREFQLKMISYARKKRTQHNEIKQSTREKNSIGENYKLILLLVFLISFYFFVKLKLHFSTISYSQLFSCSHLCIVWISFWGCVSCEFVQQGRKKSLFFWFANEDLWILLFHNDRITLSVANWLL